MSGASGSDVDDEDDAGPSDELLGRLMKLEGALEANPSSYPKSMQAWPRLAVSSHSDNHCAFNEHCIHPRPSLGRASAYLLVMLLQL